ncbi:MAG: Soluble hydrogenase 42 kDa subunit [Anaerolineales bacterium]|nr:Soluble hydrogenase 42 kDa subunit [Anaerolineales bacterium]
MRDYELLIPGPASVDDAVLEALAQPVPAHYGTGWLTVYNDVVAGLEQVFQTQDDLFTLPSSGSGALDACIGSLLAPGQRMLVGDNGFFGARLAEIARAYRVEAITVKAPPGHPLDPDAVAARLANTPDVTAVGLVHHETSTGVSNPVGEIAQVAHDHDTPIVVDAVSSMGGMSVPVDDWGIDLCVTVANKCLGSITGVAPTSVSERAWTMIDQNPHEPGWYANLKIWRRYAQEWAKWHPYPVTMPGNVLLALQASVHHILEEGLAARFGRHADVARRTREGLRALGFEMFVDDEWASPVTTAVCVPDGVSFSALSHYLRDEHGLMISGGIQELAGKIFRVGHMGRAAHLDVVERFLAAVEAFVDDV